MTWDERERMRFDLDVIEHEVREMREATTGAMYGEPVYPSPTRYTTVLDALERVRNEVTALSDERTTRAVSADAAVMCRGGYWREGVCIQDTPERNEETR